MRFGIYIFIILILFVGMVLAGFSPDGISLLVTGLMEAIVILGAAFGVLPVAKNPGGIFYAVPVFFA